MCPRAARLHPLGGLLCRSDDAEEVDADDPVGHVVALLLEAADRHDPGDVAEDVDGSELALDLVEVLPPGIAVADVEREREHRGRQVAAAASSSEIWSRSAIATATPLARERGR